jgi:hypothetical protein
MSRAVMRIAVSVNRTAHLQEATGTLRTGAVILV